MAEFEDSGSEVGDGGVMSDGGVGADSRAKFKVGWAMG